MVSVVEATDSVVVAVVVPVSTGGTVVETIKLPVPGVGSPFT